MASLTEIRYQGVAIPLARPFRDLRAFKDAGPAHLSTEAVEHIDALLKAAAFGPHFANQDALANALYDLAFPGYGAFFANQVGAKLDRSLEFLYVEIPQRDQSRCFAAERLETGEYVVVSDFVAPSQPEITRVRRAADGSL